jgi:ABC-2 type transport system permease protein
MRHLHNELAKLFGKKRTYIGFGAFLIAQTVMLLLFRFTHWQREMQGRLSDNGYLATDYLSALTVAFIMLLPIAPLLMPLYAALVGGDLMAKEVEDGTLRMILCRPISRFRLLLVKWLAGIIFCAVLVAVLGAAALLLGRIWFPWKGMFVFAPGTVFNVLTPAAGLKLFLCSLGFITVNASVILGLGLMFSCFNMKPAAAIILALSFLFINFVLENIPFFEPYQDWFLTHHFRSWVLIYAQPTPWAKVAESLCILSAVCVSSFLIGAAAFQARDIKS